MSAFAISHAWIHMSAPSDEVLTSWPRPVLDRANSAVMMPRASCIEPVWSATAAPGGHGGASAGPVIADRPERAWAAPSSIALSASGPAGPKPETRP